MNIYLGLSGTPTYNPNHRLIHIKEYQCPSPSKSSRKGGEEKSRESERRQKIDHERE
ncbi:hypothetical protein SLEP1_g20723 [Rubroshorea leprosula]|uniref:Uncharacterized protein n=1 Tax=Rubroshorea leprosula TaxID=152421 RepID=A0AAV5JCS3_9ROSI|nr:hypothetical protein SLEP1_g20723 [Rubroshorea leprosula]